MLPLCGMNFAEAGSELRDRQEKHMSRISSIIAIVLLFSACESHEHDHSAHDKNKTKTASSQPTKEKKHDHSSHEHGDDKDKSGKVVDYACGMKISASKISSKFEGKDYQFCSQACQKKFNENPKGVLTVGFEKACVCKKEMPECDCNHCSGKLEPCDCG